MNFWTVVGAVIVGEMAVILGMLVLRGMLAGLKEFCEGGEDLE